MQRGGIRVLDANGKAFDVPLGVFTAALPVATFNPVTGVLEGAAAGGGSGDVVGPAGATNTAFPRFNTATGKLIQNSPVLCSAFGDLTGVQSIAVAAAVTASRFNGPATGLRETSGPTDLTVGAIANGDVVIRSGAAIAGLAGINFALQTGAHADNHLVRWDGNGPGASIQDGTAAVLDDSANLSGMGTYNGVNVAAHAPRHNPGGADAMFTGTWASGDLPVWNGSAWVAKQQSIDQLTADSAAFTALTALFTRALKASSTYFFEANFVLTKSTTAAAAIGVNVNHSTAPTRAAYSAAYQILTAGTANNTVLQSASAINTTISGTVAVSVASSSLFAVRVIGTITTNTAGNLTVSLSSAGGNLVAKQGSGMIVNQQ